VSHLLQLGQTVLSFLLVLGILVFVHEFGHFIVAKAFKIAVPIFSLGFGPRIAGFRRKETEYRLSAIPLGGYVRLAGDEADEARTGGPEEFLSRPRWQRLCVFVAGATFNIVLAVLVMTVVFRLWGRDEPVRSEVPPEISDLRAGSSAAAAGLKIGDRVVSIAGRDARDLETQSDEILLSPDTVKPVEIEREGQRLTVKLDTDHDPIYHLGEPGWRLVNPAAGPPVIEQVTKGRPAEKAGLRVGDRVAKVSGREIVGEKEVRAIIERSVGRELQLTVLRDGNELAIAVTPMDDGGIGRIGVAFAEGVRVHHDLDVAGALRASLDWNIRVTRSVFQTLGKVLTRQISLRAFSGPIEIARVSREAVRAGETFLTFLALISLQLGIINLLPVPVLDGGHILILGVEALIRRDLSDKVKERALQAGFVFLLAFFGIVIFFDILKARM
jgi:regulator of sigma E protease